MSILGNVGSLYMIVLILLLIVGLGLIGMGFFNYVTSPKKKGTKSNNITQTGNGGFLMKNNGWLRLSLFSLIGIIIAAAILSFINPDGGMARYGNMQIHPGVNMYGNTGWGTMASTPMGGMNGMGMNMYAPMTGMQADTDTMVIYRLNQMQMQINQIQQQMMMNNMGGMQMQSMPQGGMGNMSGGGGMGMMNMGSGGMGMM
ncbi:MAG: hypothetical protein ACOYWZ_04915 [Bacillota bacterium]